MKDMLLNTCADMRSGFIVFLVALPLCLGISLASGAPLLSGLISGIVGGIVVGVLSDSHSSVSGPAAGLSTIVYYVIQDLGSYERFLLVVMLAGGIQFFFGILKASDISELIPTSVIEGMMSAIGLLIILKQIPYAIGIDSGINWSQLSFTHIHLGVLVLFLCGTTVYLLSPFFSKLTSVLPVSLILVLAFIIFSKFLPASLSLEQKHFVDLGSFGSSNSWKDVISLPNWGLFELKMLKHAIVIALVASIETLLCVEASDGMDLYKRNTTRAKELKAQGIGNLVSGLIGGLPITSVIVRSTVNITSGAKTKASSIFHGVFILIGVTYFSFWIREIPLSALALILILSGIKLAHPKKIKRHLSMGIKSSLPFLTTIVSVLLTNLLMGVVFGIVSALLIVLFDLYMLERSQIRIGREEGDVKKIVLGELVTFLCRGTLKRKLLKSSKNERIEIDLSKTQIIDPEVFDLIDLMRDKLKEKSVSISVIGKDRLIRSKEMN